MTFKSQWSRGLLVLGLVGVAGAGWALDAARAVPPVEVRAERQVQVPGENSTSRVSRVVSFLADQLTHNRNIQNLTDSRVAVTSFAAIGNFQETDKLGISIQERLVHEMYTRGFQIVDFKTTGSLKVRANGDFAHSRDIADLRTNYQINYFLSGFLEKTADGYLVHARLIDASNNLVVSSAQAFVGAKDAQRAMGDFSSSEAVKAASGPVPPKVEPNRVRLN